MITAQQASDLMPVGSSIEIQTIQVENAIIQAAKIGKRGLDFRQKLSEEMKQKLVDNGYLIKEYHLKHTDEWIIQIIWPDWSYETALAAE